MLAQYCTSVTCGWSGFTKLLQWCVAATATCCSQRVRTEGNNCSKQTNCMLSACLLLVRDMQQLLWHRKAGPTTSAHAQCIMTLLLTSRCPAPQLCSMPDRRLSRQNPSAAAPGSRPARSASGDPQICRFPGAAPGLDPAATAVGVRHIALHCIVGGTWTCMLGSCIIAAPSSTVTRQR